MEIYTVFDFNRDFHTETLNELGFHYWPYYIAGITVIVACIFLFLSTEIAVALMLFIVIPVGMFQLHKSDAAEEHYDEHLNENIHAAYLEHQEEIDTGIDESLAKHDLTRDEVCNQSTVLEGHKRKPVDVNKTLLCGNDADSGLAGMFILDDRDAVVHMGESEGEIVVVYEPNNSQ